MRTMIRNSLNLRLWLTIAIAVIPIFLFMLLDYHERREQAVAGIHAEISNRLTDADREAKAAHRAVGLALRIMARSNEVQSLGSEECSALAGRLLDSLEDFSNFGLALPDGNVVCSAQSSAEVVNVADRAWFQNSLHHHGLSPGEFITGRISKKSVVVFGSRLSGADGELRGVVFAAMTIDWFDRLIEHFKLPPNWEANLVSSSGTLLSHHPDPMLWRGHVVAPEMLQTMADVMSRSDGIAQFTGLDGRVRLYGVSEPSFARGSGFVTIGAPLEKSLNAVERRFQLSLALLATLALSSALVARLYIYRLIDVWTSRVGKVVASIAAGKLDARIGHKATARELDELARGIDNMAAEIERRDAELGRLSMAIEQSPESIIIADMDAHIVYVNKAFERTTGYTRDDVLGQNPRVLNTGLTPSSTYKEMWAMLVSGQVWRGEFHNTRKDGSTYLELATIAPIKTPDGNITHYVAVKEDITQRKQSETLLHRLAYYDALTTLPNRALLHDRLAQAIRSSSRGDTYGMLMLLDIDRFQLLNDTQGHAAGDQLLRAVAKRLSTSVREDDTVARHGDDDFAILIENIGATEADALVHAEHIARKVQRALDAPYVLGEGDGVLHYSTLSFGVSLFQGKALSLSGVLKQAEVALYRAKHEGRNNIRFFNPAMQAVVDANAHMEARLHEAIETEAFRLFFQPQVDRQGKLTGAEALIRWPVAEGKMISPAEFIPLAEDTGQIVAIGLWVLRTACAQLALWQSQADTEHLTIAVNVSARQFHQPDFVASVKKCVTAAGIKPSRLKLELTESVILGDLNETVARMNRLRELGIHFALDDFGTGYSSLSYLKRLPFDQLKIDQSFIRDMASDEGSEAIVLAILSMSQALDLEVIAEGVETPIQREFLRLHGCERYQGYLFGKPEPIENWADFLAMA